MSTYPFISALVPGHIASFSVAGPAAVESIQIVNQQIAAINYAQIQGGFEGAAQMAQAVNNMKNVAAAWPNVKAAIFSAAQQAVAAGSMAAALGHTDTTAAQLAGDVKSFTTGTLATIIASFANATAQFNAFSKAMDQAYSVSANANQAAANAIAQSQAQINYQIQMLNARQDSLRSASSIVIGIFSFGISYAVEIRQLQEEANQLSSNEQRQHLQLAMYQNSLGSFNNALNATKLASYALETLNTSLQQSSNAVSDVSGATSGNLVVMQVELEAFKNEFAQALTAVEQLLA